MALKKLDKPQATTSTSDFVNLEAGEHEGRLVYVADLGMQAREFKGDVKPPAQQLALGIEIVGQPHIVDGEERPRLLWSQPFNVFYAMNERGKELAYYKAFDPKAKDGEVADWDSVLGVPCNVVVYHRKSKDGVEFDTIDSITPIPAKYQKDVPVNKLEPATGDAEDESNPATEALYGLVKYVHSNRLGELPEGEGKVEVKSTKDVNLEDDIPF